MLRIRILGASAAALLAGAGLAVAGDINTYEPAPSPAPYSPASAYNWTGPYIGLMGGYGWGGGTVSHNGWLGGAYGGYNFQVSPNWVVGVEGDLSFTGKSGSKGDLSVKNPWNSTVRGRVGLSVDRYLIYGTGGVAFGGVEARNPVKKASTQTGWTAGIGLEAAVTEVITSRIEYRHTDLGTQKLTAGKVRYKSDDLMFGVGMKF
jgi:outer membrane immunogenic protein